MRMRMHLKRMEKQLYNLLADNSVNYPLLLWKNSIIAFGKVFCDKQ